MLTLSYGYQKPQTGDLGSIWFPALENDIQKLNDHVHDGVGSALLTPASISKPSSTIIAANWVLGTGGNYHYVVTVPVAISAALAPANDILYYDVIAKINTAGATFGDIVHPGIERETSTTFTVFVNDNTLDLILYYV